MAPSPAHFVAPYITLDEYACPCCKQLPFDFNEDHPLEPFRELFAAFALIRTAWGRAITITSGYRCIPHNRAIGGEPQSAHVYGLALDLAVAGPHELIDLKNVCVTVWPKLRIGWKDYLNTGRNIVHIDVAYLLNVRPTAAFVEGMRW
jgi:uncharacterized protein YcbK (DUF882 family)